MGARLLSPISGLLVADKGRDPVVLFLWGPAANAPSSRGYTAGSTRHSGWAGQIEASMEASVSWQFGDLHLSCIATPRCVLRLRDSTVSK